MSSKNAELVKLITDSHESLVRLITDVKESLERQIVEGFQQGDARFDELTRGLIGKADCCAVGRQILSG